MHVSVIVNSDSNGRVSVSKFKITIYLQDKQFNECQRDHRGRAWRIVQQGVSSQRQFCS